MKSLWREIREERYKIRDSFAPGEGSVIKLDHLFDICVVTVNRHHRVVHGLGLYQPVFQAVIEVQRVTV
jgi:hypothetical protein